MLARLAVALFCTFAIAAETAPVPAVPTQDENAATQTAYLLGRWTWSTPIGRGTPESGAITFAADNTYEANGTLGRWALRPITETSFEVTLSGTSRTRRLALRMVNANTMVSEGEGLTYLKVQ